MKYKIVTSGKSKEVSLNELSQNLKIQSEVYALSDKEIYLGLIYHKTLVFFSVEFAEYAIKNYAKKKNPKAEICINLTRKWLEDRESVSDDELRAAADAANAAHSAAYAAYAAAYADAAAYANAAASNAANAAADADAAYANADATYAAYAAAYSAGVDKDKECLRQGEFIIDFLKSGGHLFLV